MGCLVGVYLLRSVLFDWLVSAVLCVVTVRWVVWLMGICCTLCCYSKMGCLVDGYLLCSVLLQ